MPIFTLAAGAILSTFFSGTFLTSSAILFGTTSALTLSTSVLAFGLGTAASIGLNYVAQALAGNKPAEQDYQGTQGQLQASGAVPRSFGVGYHVTGGSLVWANTFRTGANQTPNGYFSQVIALSDIPGEQLIGLWVDGQKVTIGASDGAIGNRVTEYVKAGVPYLWIKFYDGTQVAADPFLTSFASSASRPYGADRIGTGVCYAVVTASTTPESDNTEEAALWSGFPSFKFELSGIKLYDPSKDSTVGGSGSHVYSNPATWGGDGDQLPAVQAYNILRGIRYAGNWFYGLQNMGAARLPAANWIAQINKCRATVTGESGLEPTYRAGGQINIDSQPANAVDALLTACQGRLCEIGGFYKIYLGTPDASVISFADADLLSSESQSYRPFFALSDSVNGIQGTYPNPAEGWEQATAPPIYRSDLEIRDGNRRLMAAPQFNFVPYRAQVQRLQKSGIEEAQRARTHHIPLPPAYWAVEPGDVVTWTSTRNGYISKLFRVDAVSDKANLDVTLDITEIDPSDYDWTHATDFNNVPIGPTTILRPAPQGVVDWFAEGYALYDSDGLSRRPAIRIVWDGTVLGVVGIQYEVRLAIDLSTVTRGRTDQLQAAALIISQGLIPETEYQVRGQYIPSAPRAMLWSDWLTVTTLATISEDLPAEIAVQVTSVMDLLNDRVIELEQRLSTVISKLAAQDYDEIRSVRSQLTARSDVAMAEIATVETVAVDASEAVAVLETTVTAQFADTNASVTENSTAIASIEGWGAASYSVTLDVNGYASGFSLLNGGPGFSTTTFITDKFMIAAPGAGGGSPVPIFAVGTIDGLPKVGIRGDVYVDGTIAGTKLIANTITANQIAANTITADEILAGTIDATRIAAGTITSDSGVIGALGVKSLSIGDAAVTVPSVQSYSGNMPTSGASPALSFNLSVDTTGLSGKTISVYAVATAGTPNLAAGGTASSWILTINSVNVSNMGSANYKSDSMSAAGAVNVTATGGVMSIPVTFTYWSAVAAPGSFATLYAQAAKR